MLLLGAIAGFLYSVPALSLLIIFPLLLGGCLMFWLGVHAGLDYAAQNTAAGADDKAAELAAMPDSWAA